MRTLLFVALGLSAVASTMTADASMQAQVESYAEMVCGTNLKTGNPEEPSAKKRCISGLMKLGKNAFKVASPSIQKCKQEANFFSCIKGHTTDTTRIKQAAREHGREIKTMSKTPHHLNSPRLDRLGETIQHVLGQRSILWSNNSKYWGCKGRNLYGYYRITNELVVMCQGFHNGDLVELIDTLKHEGWHAVQHRCRNGVPYLDDQQIAARLPQSDVINVHSYHPKQRRLESEARVMAKIDDAQWIQLVKNECKGKEKRPYKPNLGFTYSTF
jgi:hypothetical protein